MGIGYLSPQAIADFERRRIQGVTDYFNRLDSRRAAPDRVTVESTRVTDTSVAAADPISTGARERQAAADATVARGPLMGKQRSVVMGSAVPLVWCRRRSEQDDGGGVFISPPATEVQVTTDTDGNVVSRYVLVLSQGDLENVEEQYLYHGQDRQGTLMEQAYNVRPSLGVWDPGNTEEPAQPSNQYTSWVDSAPVTNATTGDYDFSLTTKGKYVTKLTVVGTLTQGGLFGESISLASKTLFNDTYSADGTENQLTLQITGSFGVGGGTAIELRVYERNTEPVERLGYGGPLYHGGGGGTFENLSSIAVENTTPVSAEAWELQHHVFIRRGVQAYRIRQDDIGPSDNFVDLVRYLWVTIAGVPLDLIDSASLSLAAEFTHATGLWWNGALSIPSSIPDFVSRVAPYFLLTPSTTGGKLGLQPIVPATAAGISTAAVSPDLQWGPADLIPGTTRISYIPREDRQPFKAVVSWRLQPEGQIGETVTSEIGPSGVTEERLFDLSDFASTHSHCAVFAAATLSRAQNISHTMTTQVRPGAWQLSVGHGDVVQVTMPRRSSAGDDAEFSRYYRLLSMQSTAADAVTVALEHLPVTAGGASVVAVDAAAVI